MLNIFYFTLFFSSGQNVSFRWLDKFWYRFVLPLPLQVLKFLHFEPLFNSESEFSELDELDSALFVKIP